MKSERFMDALTEIEESYIQEAGERMDSPPKVRPRLRLARSLLLAAVLILLLVPTAWAAYNHYMSTRVPESGLHVYTFDEASGKHEFELPDVAMVINVDTRPEASDIVMRFGWLPEGAPDPSEPRYGEDSSYYGFLDFFKDHELYPGWEQRSIEEMLSLAGMTEEEAKSWYGGYSWENENKALLHASVLDAATLYQEDLLLGMYGGEATVVQEGTRGSYELLEVQIDYTEMYRDIEKKNAHLAPEVEWIKNYLFLYEPQEQYLIFVGGSDLDFPFETLEKIADNMEIRVTDFPSHPAHDRQSYIILDLGRG